MTARPQVELPELPERGVEGWYTASQMHAYAEQAIAESEARAEGYRVSRNAYESDLVEAQKRAEGLADALRSIAEDCRRGADQRGMTPAGVQDIARRCDAAIAQEAEREAGSA